MPEPFIPALLHAGMTFIKVLRHLAAAYTERAPLPEPCTHSVAWPDQLVRAAEAAGMEVPQSLLDPKLTHPVPKVILPGYTDEDGGVANCY